jgi:hypothetical protein
MRFRHERIDDYPPAGRMTFCLTEDLTGNGRPDVLVGAMGGKPTVTLPLVGKRLFLPELPLLDDLIGRLEVNVFWYETPGAGGGEWTRHEIGRAPNLSVGGAFGDLTSDGRSDLVTGQNLDSELSWFEQPSDPRGPWTRRLITDEFRKYHDVAVTDVDVEGVEVVSGGVMHDRTSQLAQALDRAMAADSRRMGDRNRSYARELEWDRIAARTAALYDG